MDLKSIFENHANSIFLIAKEKKFIWEQIEKSYSESHRHYHTLQHLEEIFAQEEQFELSTQTRFALWYHDIVYQPLASDNEEKSIKAIPEFLTFVTRLEAREYILASKHSSNTVYQDPNKNLFLDLDLSILGSDYDRFCQYDEQICKEFVDVPKEDFHKGRSALLKKWNQKPIFRTARAIQLWEDKAHTNITKILREKYL